MATGRGIGVDVSLAASNGTLEMQNVNLFFFDD